MRWAASTRPSSRAGTWRSSTERVGRFAYYAGRLDEAEAAYDKVLELNPDYRGAHLDLGLVYLARSKPEAALAEVEREKEPLWQLYGLALVYHALGRQKDADTKLAEFIENFQGVAAYQSWRVANSLGDKGVPNRLDSWGSDWHHDWATWRRIFPQYLEELTR